MSTANQLVNAPIASVQSLASSICAAVCSHTRWRWTPVQSAPKKLETSQFQEGSCSINCDQLLTRTPASELDLVSSKVVTRLFGEYMESLNVSAVVVDILNRSGFSKRSCKVKPQFTIGNTTFILDPKKSVFYIQRRGFRTRTSSPGLQTGKQHAVGTSASTKSSKSHPVNERLRKMIGTEKSENKLLNDLLNDVKKYENDLSVSEKPKLTEKVKVAFYDGYKEGKGRVHSYGSAITSLLTRVFHIALYAFVLWTVFYLLSAIQEGGLSSVITTKGEVEGQKVEVSFDDVRGVDEAKSELEEIVSYLRDPEKYSKLGGRLPKGVLLVGPPGTGKTLLARAIAGEADVPFFQAVGSEFDEVLVGSGAKRVRNLFASAKSKPPCVIFIDEIDSVGGKRVSNSVQPFANQTINQLLSEMDGFHQNEGVIVIGATNRKQDLDKALLRPGRFDVQVHVGFPDLKGRKEILNLYLKRVTLADDVSCEILAKRTTGATGADIENLVNQAALKAARDGMESVTMAHLEEAYDRVLMGPERKAGRLPCEETNRNTAFHEAGHAIVSYYNKDAMPLHKVTIIPRGQALGITFSIPDKENYGSTRSQLLAEMDTCMGGRVAEELIFGPEKITTGAASDLQRATEIATDMVKQFAMSDKVGLRDYTLSKKYDIVPTDLSPSTMEMLDNEIKRLLQESYDRASAVLKQHSREHHRLAEALLEHETLDADELKNIIEGKKINAEKT